MITVPEFYKRKLAKKKISMITCYDSSFASIVNDSPIDIILIGDSSAMVMHGHSSTVNADATMIETHVAAVARTAKNKFIVADMPFLSNRMGTAVATEIAGRFIKAGAHAVKIEGIRGNEEIVKHLVESGIPVMGHLGLTPQSVNQFGGMKVQATSPEAQEILLTDAKAFEQTGAFSLVLECVPNKIAKTVTDLLNIPTIGIGAGVGTDGQVLVLHDLLGFNPNFKPKFLRQYLNGYELIKNAFTQYHEDVMQESFPNEKESYHESFKNNQ
jgi:3-methyl-2-oxobutanoate hydroxymethyltransferase